MSDVTRILSQIQAGDSKATEQLLPVVYRELRELAAARMAHEKPGQTLQATALVHEAYLRLVNDPGHEGGWDSRGHFFASAAEAMRRILIENARRRKSLKRGGDQQIESFHDAEAVASADPEQLLLLNEVFDKLTAEDAEAAEVAKLRLFAGLSVAEAASALNISRTTAHRRWKYAQAWLTAEMRE